MAEPNRTQKQIAERYKGNLAYYKQMHPWRRARFWVSFLAIAGGVAAMILFQRRGPETFFNPGEISSAHAAFGHDCAKCHDKGLTTGGALTPARVVSAVKERMQRGAAFNPLDRKCQTCHEAHTLHQPNVVADRSCTACHHEHEGRTAMKTVAMQNCLACHNSRDVMSASAAKGRTLPSEAFRFRRAEKPRAPARVIFPLARPVDGYTQVFSSFAKGHPEFQLEQQKARDPDVLRFNHQRHFSADIPLVNGRKLDCAYCHQPDGEGRFMRRVNYEANCQACHSLQFDPRNPELTVPHGDPAAARDFLRTLPSQYEALAIKKGLTRPDQFRSFVTTQMTRLRERVRSGEEFERQIFFTTNPYQPTDGKPIAPGASFHGCAFCHEVKAMPSGGAPAITKPFLVDRWMPQANFKHLTHASVSCTDCHKAKASRETSDVLMPSKASCVTCHSPAGKVASECITCHTYHAPKVTAGDSRAP